MIEHSVECQFRMDDITDNDEDGKNDAKIDGNVQQNGEKHESGDDEWNDATTSLCMQSWSQ